MTRRRIIALLMSVFVAAIQAEGAVSSAKHPAQSRLQRYESLQIRMAIPVRITVYARDAPSANQAIQAAFARIKQIDRLLSHYDPDSELSKLGQHAEPGKPVPISRELFTVLSHAERVSRRTGGAFDVTIGPLMDLWRRSRRHKRLPSASELDTARRLVGYQNIHLNSLNQSVSLMHAGMRLDLGGIAKGFAADEALRVLNEHGIERALIDAGGDIVVGQPPPQTDGWRIGIAPLGSPDGEPRRYLSLSHAAVATSGDTSQFVEIDGVRYSHIVNPRTGLGLTTRSSVTVIARDGITSDSWASAVSVLGPERGLRLLRTVESTDALIVVSDDSGVRTWESPGLSKLESRSTIPSPR